MAREKALAERVRGFSRALLVRASVVQGERAPPRASNRESGGRRPSCSNSKIAAAVTDANVN